MSTISKFEAIGRLLQKYGVLLTSHQKKVMERYYFYDLTMQEIAEEEKITRSAVSEVIKQSLEKLTEYEQKLSLLKRDQDVEALLEKLEQDSGDPSKIINQIRDILKHGI